MLPKPKLIRDKKLLAAVKREPCGVRGCPGKTTPAHVRHGANHHDTPDNVCPLCWPHQDEQHKLGWRRFKAKYPEVQTYQEIQNGRPDPKLWKRILEPMRKKGERIG